MFLLNLIFIHDCSALLDSCVHLRSSLHTIRNSIFYDMSSNSYIFLSKQINPRHARSMLNILIHSNSPANNYAIAIFINIKKFHEVAGI